MLEVPQCWAPGGTVFEGVEQYECCDEKVHGVREGWALQVLE